MKYKAYQIAPEYTADIVLYRFDGWTKTEKYKRED